jgi:putative hydrolase of the HAD superfamily
VKAVLFDLDGTLYPEIDFVKSGFGIIAGYLSRKHNLDADRLLRHMLSILNREGRGKIFDRLLADFGLDSEGEVEFLVELYRSHKPDIHLYNDVIPALKLLRHIGIRMGIVTDGLDSVQRKKVAALGLESLFDTIVYSDELGKKYWKPSPTPYQTALNRLRVSPSEAAYVGDDPSKDFISPNRMGMLTIQIKRQQQPDYIADASTEEANASYTVSSLLEILPIIGKKH